MACSKNLDNLVMRIEMAVPILQMEKNLKKKITTQFCISI